MGKVTVNNIVPIRKIHGLAAQGARVTFLFRFFFLSLKKHNQDYRQIITSLIFVITSFMRNAMFNDVYCNNLKAALFHAVDRGVLVG